MSTAAGYPNRHARHRSGHNGSSGNDFRDLASKGIDPSSPNDTTPVSRQLAADCVDMPAELPGVLTVSASDDTSHKASLSNYGLGVIDVAAPGVRTWSTTLGGQYGRKSGTSMASPHAAGVAALLKSTRPGATPGQLLALLRDQANDVACHALQPPPKRDGTTRPAQTCTGTLDDNAFFGEGIVDALDAVTAP